MLVDAQFAIDGSPVRVPDKGAVPGGPRNGTELGRKLRDRTRSSRIQRRRTHSLV